MLVDVDVRHVLQILIRVPKPPSVSRGPPLVVHLGPKVVLHSPLMSAHWFWSPKKACSCSDEAVVARRSISMAVDAMSGNDTDMDHKVCDFRLLFPSQLQLTANQLFLSDPRATQMRTETFKRLHATTCPVNRCLLRTSCACLERCAVGARGWLVRWERVGGNRLVGCSPSTTRAGWPDQIRRFGPKTSVKKISARIIVR